MSLTKRFYYSMTALFGDITALYCLFLFFSDASEHERISFDVIALLLLGAAAVLINCLLGRREIPILWLVGANAAIAAASIAAMVLLPHTIDGFWAWLFAVMLFGYPAARAVYLVRNPVTATTMLTYSEMSVMGTGFFFLIQLGPFQAGTLANALCVTALLLNLLSLSSLRMAGALRVRPQGGSGLRRGLILTLTAALLLAAALLLGLALPATKEAVLAAVGAVGNGIATVFRLLGRLIGFLLSLIPESENAAMEMEEPLQFVMPEEGLSGQAAFPLWAAVTLISVIAAAVIAFLTVLFVKLRKVRMGRLGVESAVLREKSAAPSLFSLLRELLRKIGAKMGWYRLFLSHYNSCAGVFIRMERRGKRCGLPRAPGQTPREYLESLAAELPPEAPAREVFSQLADQIDLWCFLPDWQLRERMDREKIRTLKSAVRPRLRRRPTGLFSRFFCAVHLH